MTEMISDKSPHMLLFLVLYTITADVCGWADSKTLIRKALAVPQALTIISSTNQQ